MGTFSDARKEYDRQSRSLTITGMNSTPDTKRPWSTSEGQPSEVTRRSTPWLKKLVTKGTNAQFEIGIGRAMLASDFRDESKQLETSFCFSGKPLEGMSESDRGTARAAVLASAWPLTQLNGLLDHAAD